MGNTNPSLGVKGSCDVSNVNMKGRPIVYHRVHSENIQISVDGHKAKRVESFCKGICFGDRPVAVNERIHLKFAEVSTSWSGVVRLGLTSHDPLTINAAELPRYACPDLTYKPGYWAKALPEKYAEQGTTLYYYLTRTGDVMFGINGEEKGLFFSGVPTNTNLWALVDIYGNTTCMEFIDGWQMNNIDSPHTSVPALNNSLQQLSVSCDSPGSCEDESGASTVPPGGLPPGGLGPGALLPIKYHYEGVFSPLTFHHTMGRNVCLSSDLTLAVRLAGEYCNGYVFTGRPLLCGEAVVVQVVALEEEYTGGLAFGMTSCDPITLSPDQLPDDSDLLLDRAEYWVVNKDVCTTPEVGDELSFYLTVEGEVRYGKNGHHIATLMYIDKTLPMWAFLDVYGTAQKVKCLGVLHADGHGNILPGSSGLTVALPPPRTSTSSADSVAGAVLPSGGDGGSPPPRPPPPRPAMATTAPPRKQATSPAGKDKMRTPPVLPPKHARSPASPLHPAALMTSPRVPGSPLPPPLVPVPLRGLPPSLPADPAPRKQPTPPRQQPTPQPLPEQSSEALDNETNECKVCMNNAVDCVLYTCGHMCLCHECAQDIKNKHNLCPICRQDIKDIIRIYRS